MMSLFKEDGIFSTKTNLTYGPLKSKTYINMVIYICTKLWFHEESCDSAADQRFCWRIMKNNSYNTT